ncbi:MAG: hypothetical protein JKY92_06805, partial [Magnetovibrio sp.]|nr:hypothetical protein [Magnetovibrio sp.]
MRLKFLICGAVLSLALVMPKFMDKAYAQEIASLPAMKVGKAQLPTVLSRN